MKIKIYALILLTSFAATFLRLFINNNFIVSIIGSLFCGFFIAKKLSLSQERIIISGFFSCFTSFSGFIYFLHNILNQGDWIKFIIFFNLIIILNIFAMYFGFWISRKIT
jgi:CrcB protein|tara:strand:+ start:174 stop:503 length:330 start_codon:yes stop_codon:yes gene_type:complete